MMHKSMPYVMMSIAMFTWSLIAQTQGLKPMPKPMPPRDNQEIFRKMNPSAYSNMLAKTGGLIQIQSKGKVVHIVNVQKKVAFAEISGTMEAIKKMIRLPFTLIDKPGKADVTALIADAFKEASNGAVVVVHDTPGQPSLLIAPEAHWALINVAALTTPGISEEVLSSRTSKELWRAVGYVLGAANSSYDGCVLKTISKPEDLDSLNGKGFAVDSFGKISKQAGTMGMQASRMITYRKACEEGWAPTPTNNVQKAIWEEVKVKR